MHLRVVEQMIPAEAARDVLHERLEALFSRETFAQISDVQAPKVFLGFPVDEPQFYVAVDDLPDTATTTGAASMGHAEFTFSLTVYMCAIGPTRAKASGTVLSYMATVFAAVLADQQLNFTVENAFPRVKAAGSAPDSSKSYIAAIDLAIECSVGSVCPAKIKEIINELNRND